MFRVIKAFSLQRRSWLMLAVIALLLESFALYMQHMHAVQPCNECIYIRLGVLGIAIAGLIGVLHPRSGILRWGALAVWFLALGWSLFRANLLLNLEHIVREGGEASCARFKGFPEWLPLERWFPDMFEPRAMCGDVSWTFLNQSVTFWIWIALWGMALAAVLTLFAQFQSEHPKTVRL